MYEFEKSEKLRAITLTFTTKLLIKVETVKERFGRNDLTINAHMTKIIES